MNRMWVLLVLLVVSLTLFAPTTDARTVLGIGLTDGGVFYMSASDTKATSIELIFSGKSTEMGTFTRRHEAVYIGWLREWQGVHLSVGGLVLTKVDTSKTSPPVTVGQRQHVTLRASASTILSPVRVTVGVSGAGVDYLAGLEFPISDAINLFAGYVSWPQYHSGITTGMSFRW